MLVEWTRELIPVENRVQDVAEASSMRCHDFRTVLRLAKNMPPHEIDIRSEVFRTK